MGGGDLNLKKSWHPNTIKNQERVWRAEQADAAEKRKLAELKQEISAERDRDELYRIGKSSGVLPAGGGLGSGSLGGGGVDGGGGNSGSGAKKLEWMYRGAENLLNREEYLLGRQVDKSFEKQEAAEREAKQKQMVGVTQPKNHVEHECIPFSIRQFHGASATEDQVDLQRKIAEDPLMAVKQREMETRKKLLENPVKLAEIHRLLRTQAAAGSSSSDRRVSKKSKKDKKSRKSHKSSKSSHKDATKRTTREANDSDDNDEDDDDGNLDAQLERQLRRQQGDEKNNGGTANDIKQLLELKYRQINDELDKYSTGKKSKKSKKSKKKPKRSTKKRSHRRSSSSSSSSSEDSDARGKTSSKQPQKPSPAAVVHNNPFAKRSDPTTAALLEAHEMQNRQRSFERPAAAVVAVRRPRSRSRSRSRSTRRTTTTTAAKRRSRSPRRQSARKSSPTESDRRRRRTQSRENRGQVVRKTATPPPNRSRNHNDEDRDVDRRRKRPHSRSPSVPTKHRSQRSQRSASTSRERRTERRRDRSPAAKPAAKDDDASKMAQKFATVSSKKPAARSSSSSSSASASSASSSSSSSSSSASPRPSAVAAIAPRNYGLVTAAGEKIAIQNRDSKPTASATSAASSSVRPAAAPPAKRTAARLTSAERQLRLEQMQANAEWRDEDRRRTVSAYRAAEKREEEKQTAEFDRDFGNKAMQKAMHASSSNSVEARLKANKNNIQRSSRAMDENFARR